MYPKLAGHVFLVYQGYNEIFFLFLTTAKLHLQGYSCHNLHYLSGSPLPTEEEEMEMRTKFEKWRVSSFTDLITSANCIILYFIIIIRLG